MNVKLHVKSFFYVSKIRLNMKLLKYPSSDVKKRTMLATRVHKHSPLSLGPNLDSSAVMSVCMSSDIPAPLQVLEEDSGPAGALRRLRRLSLLLRLQRKAWDETLHFNAARLLCSQRHMADCCQGQGSCNTKHFVAMTGPTLIQRGQQT